MGYSAVQEVISSGPGADIFRFSTSFVILTQSMIMGSIVGNKGLLNTGGEKDWSLENERLNTLCRATQHISDGMTFTISSNSRISCFSSPLTTSQNLRGLFRSSGGRVLEKNSLAGTHHWCRRPSYHQHQCSPGHTIFYTDNGIWDCTTFLKCCAGLHYSLTILQRGL